MTPGGDNVEDEQDELIEGFLALKQDDGGWRHYIKRPDGTDRDIHCAATMDVKVSREYERPDDYYWLHGRYEASIGNRAQGQARAWLVIGQFFPKGREIEIEIPLGTIVRLKR
jgi:hypothetical protein